MSDSDSITHSWAAGDDDTDNWSDMYTSKESKGPLLSRKYTRPNPKLIETYYTVYKGLSNSSGSRKSLPPELILYICRLAGFGHWCTKEEPPGYGKVYASSEAVQWLTWFQTKPFTKKMLRQVKSVQLVTMSHHQGFVGDRDAGSWSWFEFQVARPTDQATAFATAKRRPNGDEISWRCLAHPVDEETADVQGDFAEHEGDVFDLDHELWTQIEEGDVLQVVMKARFGAWSNTASDGIVRVSTWWEPSIGMLNLMNKDSSSTQPT